MPINYEIESAIEPYRVLDLTEGGCMIGARMLGDLGADIIKIEPPGGSPSRIAPYYKNIADPDKSLFWFAYNFNKRGITLDIAKPEGQKIFKRLVQTADVVMESFQPGFLDQLGLGYLDLCSIKPDLIMTSITPFGLNGPRANHKGNDLTSWASGGYLYICGGPENPPVWISFPQALLHAGAEAAAGTMTALWHRRKNGGEGQQVDVSIQECVIACDFNAPEMWDLNKIDLTRYSRGLNIGTKGVRINNVWACQDGYIIFLCQGGVQPFISSMNALVKWMSEESMAEDWLRAMDWGKDYDASKLTQQVVDRMESIVRRFILSKTKRELYKEGAIKRRILIGPLNSARDIWEDEQLQSRDFWKPMNHPELGVQLMYPGPFIKFSDNPLRNGRRAPLIGEHNNEIYLRDLKYTEEELTVLKQNAVI